MAPSTISSGRVLDLTGKMSNNDKDFRYMGLNDLLADLTQMTGQLDDHSASRLVDAVLKTLEDPNGEVQNMSVKCLGPLIKHSNEIYIQTIVNRLCKTDGAEALKDISATALRTVISELSPNSSLANSITTKLTPKLVTQLEHPEDKSDLLLESIDVLQELLSRFGKQVEQLPESLLTRIVHALVKLLDNSRPAVRKRSIMALGLLSIHLPTSAHDRFMSELVELLPLAKSNEKVKTLLGLLGQISRSEAHLPQPARRFSSFLQTLATPVLSTLSIDDDELRETALLSCEAFVLGGGPQIRKFDAQILEACFTYIKYDPNYSYDEDDAGDDDMDMDDADEGSDFGSNYDKTYSDDDDVSWKIRKGSAKLLRALISTRPDIVKSSGSQIASVLISRLNEREETVCLEIISTFAALIDLEAGTPATRAGSPSRKRARESDTEMESDPKTLRAAVAQSIGKIKKHLLQQINGKSVSTKVAAFNALAALARSNEISLEPSLHSMLGPTKQALASATSGHNAAAGLALKLAALDFTQALIDHASISSITANMEMLSSLLTDTLEAETLYKVASTALQSILSLLVIVARHGDINAHTTLFSCILQKTKSEALDHELRDQLIKALGTAMAHLPAGASSSLMADAAGLLLQRLQSEPTQLAATQAIAEAANAQVAVLQTDWASQVVRVITPFARNMSDKSLRAAALTALPLLLPRAASLLEEAVVRDLTSSMNHLLKSGDAQVLPSAVQVLGSLALNTQGPLQQLVQKETLPVVLGLIDLPAVQARGPALEAVLLYLSSVSLQGEAVAVIASLSSNLKDKNLPILGRCIAACLPLEKDALATHIKAIQAPKTPEEERALALYIVGEYSSKAAVDKNVADLVLTQFSSPSEKVKAGAAFAFGSLAARDMDSYLPVLFKELGKSSSDHFLLAVSLNEVIAHNEHGDRVEVLLSHSDAIWERLFRAADDERAKATLAECVGRLTLLRPSRFLPQLQTQMRSEETSIRSVVIRAVRHTFTAASHDVVFDDLLRPFVVDFLSMMEDSDLEIRRLALSTLYSAAFHKPQLVHDHIGRLLPLLYKETSINKDLVHVVQMGPFKHTVDDGLVLRKSAFETLHTLLDSFFSVNEMQGIYTVILTGLDDVHEIKMLSYLMLSTLASKDPEGVQQHLEQVTAKMVKVMAAKTKENAVKSDREKDAEIKRSVMRCAVALKDVAGPSTPAFAAFWQDMQATRQGEIESLSQELRGVL
ncbi:armadillo-type protein [Protomyces lactucae-debilis]|uniref:Armadillo-type protein n=1 Tax=Protomyces lactucae-debilis TaxID=2754530 RepID=A0A1Y2EWT1_PROLT|nr:armadillo-type protein [Protomyces lactucae-debilis]ORY76043.1 armadillo-type protein [Protomyces lactucae-debilis]